VKPPRAKRSNRYQLGVAELLGAGLSNQIAQVGMLARLLPPLAVAAGTAAWTAAKTAIAERRQGELSRRAGPGTRFKFAPATPFNTSITNQRSFAGVTLPMAEVKQIGKLHGASVNDMVLWLCSTALRGYLADARELPDKTLVAGVPISLRAEGDTSSNNQVSGTLIDLATHEADAGQRLALIMAGTRAMKAQLGAFGSLIPKDFPSLGSPWLLSGLASLYGRSRLADRLRVANVVISNVPGPQVPLYLAGAKMTGIFPVSIVVHGIALNITVQSYMGQLCFGLIACRRALPDVAELATQLQRALQTLLRLPQPETAASTTPVKTPAAPEIAKPAAPQRRAKKARSTARLTVVETLAGPAASNRRRTRRATAA
jgi:diacylglycerol O-acyltransferase / wax synthase